MQCKLQLLPILTIEFSQAIVWFIVLPPFFSIRFFFFCSSALHFGEHKTHTHLTVHVQTVTKQLLADAEPKGI